MDYHRAHLRTLLSLEIIASNVSPSNGVCVMRESCRFQPASENIGQLGGIDCRGDAQGGTGLRLDDDEVLRALNANHELR